MHLWGELTWPVLEFKASGAQERTKGQIHFCLVKV